MREALHFLGLLLLIAVQTMRYGGRFVGELLPFLSRAAVGPGRFARMLRFFGVEPPLSPAVLGLLARLMTDVRQEAMAEKAELEEDPDYESGQDVDSTSSEDDATEASDDEDEDALRTPSASREMSEGPIDLYTDLFRNTDPSVPPMDDPQDLNAILLSHLTNSLPVPVTRRRYQDLALTRYQAPLRSSPNRNAMIGDIPQLDAARIEQLETQLLCVVCRTDVRRIISWPCRCLSLCEGCKDHLAAVPSSNNSCPTCRKTVTGYSRLFVP